MPSSVAEAERKDLNPNIGLMRFLMKRRSLDRQVNAQQSPRGMFVDHPVEVVPISTHFHISFVCYLTGHCKAMSREGIRHELDVWRFLF